MTLTTENIDKLKNKLLFEKERIENEIDRLTKPSIDSNHTTVFNEMGSSEDENASEVEEYSDNIAIEKSLEKQLVEVLEALDKIANGTYGKCENCGTDISLERLLAYPSAKTCIKC